MFVCQEPIYWKNVFSSLLQIMITSHHPKALLRQTSDMWIINRRVPCHPVAKIPTVEAGPMCVFRISAGISIKLSLFRQKGSKFDLSILEMIELTTLCNDPEQII